MSNSKMGSTVAGMAGPGRKRAEENLRGAYVDGSSRARDAQGGSGDGDVRRMTDSLGGAEDKAGFDGREEEKGESHTPTTLTLSTSTDATISLTPHPQAHQPTESPAVPDPWTSVARHWAAIAQSSPGNRIRNRNASLHSPDPRTSPRARSVSDSPSLRLLAAAQQQPPPPFAQERPSANTSGANPASSSTQPVFSESRELGSLCQAAFELDKPGSPVKQKSPVKPALHRRSQTEATVPRVSAWENEPPMVQMFRGLAAVTGRRRISKEGGKDRGK